MKVTESLCSIGSVTTWPVAMCSAAMMEAVPLRTYSTPRPAARRPAGPAVAAARDTCGTWPGSRSSHRCRSPRCPAAGAGRCRRPRRPAPELLVVAAVEPAPDPVGPQFQAGQDPAHLGGGDARAVQAGGDQVMRPRRDALGRTEVAAATIASRTPGPYTSAGRCGAGRPGPAGRRGRTGAARSAPWPPCSPARQRSARSPSPRRPATRSWPAVPAPAARTAAARSPPAAPCAAALKPQHPCWLPAP